MKRSSLAASAFAALASIFAAADARAQALSVTDLSAIFGTIGTSAALVVPALGDTRVPAERATLVIANASAASTVSCGYSGVIAVNGVGTFTLGPGQSAFWPRGMAPGNAIWCIASGSSTPLQVAIGN
jgi:hypothetical protein